MFLATYVIAKTSLAYYSTIFSSLQQKEISGFLTYMWQADPFKAKWSILAKAYSLIRDSQGKNNAPLDKFLAISVPLIGIIEPERYLQALSWEVAIDDGGQTIMRRQNNSIDQGLLAANISVNDVIKNSYDQGYFKGNLSDVLLSDNEATMAMTSLAQPTTNAQLTISTTSKDLEDHVVAVSDVQCFCDEEEASGMPYSEENLSSEADIATSSAGVSHELTMADDPHQVPPTAKDVEEEGAVAAPGHSTLTTTLIGSPTFDPDNISPGTLAVIDASMTDIQRRTNSSLADPPISSLSASAFHLDGEYPFNAEFDPDLPSFVFDPFMGNQFNVFDMSDTWDDFIDFDACS